MNTYVESDVYEDSTSTGKAKFWQIRVVTDDNGDVFLQTESWQETQDGDESKHLFSNPKKIVGKNRGRSNETDDLQQAESEMQSQIQKKIDKGYAIIGSVSKGKHPLPMLAHKYNERAKYIQFPALIQSKLDGCVYGSTILQTSDGKLTIKEIVDKQLKVKVLSFNSQTGKLEFKPVINWFNNGKLKYDGWIDVVPEFGTRVKCTPNHKFLTDKRSWVECKDLNSKEDKIIAMQYDERWISLLAGTLLGDTCAAVDLKGSNKSYRIIYSHTNRDLFSHKIALLSLTGKLTEFISGYGSSEMRFVSDALSKSDFPIELFYHTGHNANAGQRKIVLYRHLKRLITRDALALWIADDGNIAFNNANPLTPVLSISTHSHSDEQLKHFITYFKRVWQCTPSLIHDKRVKSGSGKLLHFNTKDTLYILNKLRTKHIRGVEYKFYFPTEGYVNPGYKLPTPTTFRISKSKHMPIATKYDIEVADNHNYIANGIVVHNCRLLSDGIEGWTRNGKPQVKECVQHILPIETGDYILDGELILPLEIGDFNDTASAVKKFDPDKSPLLKYHIFDVIPPEDNKDMPFSERIKVVEFIVKKTSNPNVLAVPTVIVKSDADLARVHLQNVEDGFEGTMVRNADSPYRIKHRSNDLQKVKDYDDDEFNILDAEKAEGNHDGCIVFVCRANVPCEAFRADGVTACKHEHVQTKDGNFYHTFTVSPKWSLAKRRDAFQHRFDYVGKRLTVRYQGLSSDNKPRFPRGIAIRDDL